MNQARGVYGFINNSKGQVRVRVVPFRCIWQTIVGVPQHYRYDTASDGEEALWEAEERIDKSRLGETMDTRCLLVIVEQTR